MKANIAKETRIMTDEAGPYGKLKEDFASYEFVRHGVGEYVRGDVHTNSAEGFYSVFKRGMKGVYQHCSEKHLHRYVAELDFRYNNRVKLGVDDKDRAERSLKGVVGKRPIVSTHTVRLDLSPFFPPVRSKVRSCRYADRDGVFRFGRAPFSRSGRLPPRRCAQPASMLASDLIRGHRRSRREAALTPASTAAG